MGVTWYVRPDGLVAIARGDSYLFAIPGKPPVRIEGVDVEAMAQVLALAVQPIARTALLEASSEDAIAALLDMGVLVETAAPIDEAPPAKRVKRMVICLGGAIGVVGALDHALAFARRFAERVDVVIGEGARHFIQPKLFAYYGFTTWLDPFEPAHGANVPHEYLAINADVVLVASASASTLHKLASGACSDLTSLIVAATRAPVVVAPSMNPQMWLHPPVARNVAQLRADGIWVVEPTLGRVVADLSQSGVGSGYFDPAQMMNALTAILEQQRG